MQRNLGAFAVLALSGLLSSVVGADEPPAGVAEIIAERQALMTELEDLMRPLDSFTVGEAHDQAELKAAAASIADKLRTLPKLFPPASNLYDPAAATPVTLALPAIWQSLPAFTALAESAAAAATKVSAANGADELRAAALELRAACNACHAPFLRPYQPSTVTKEDLEFDFDAIFEDDGAATEPAEPE